MLRIQDYKSWSERILTAGSQFPGVDTRHVSPLEEAEGSLGGLSELFRSLYMKMLEEEPSLWGLTRSKSEAGIYSVSEKGSQDLTTKKLTEPR